MKTIVAIIVVLILAAGAYALFHTQTPAPTTSTATTTEVMATTTDTSNDVSASASADASVSVGTPVTITYDGTSFSPASVTIKQGQSVTFVNKSSSPMWVASDPHPIHNGYDGTTRDEHCAPGYTGPAPFDECSTATSYTFTFTKVGRWGYHNHANHAAAGTITVAQ
ncbi:MAG TPA: plastocyanin/azurin family copper-binding protein [Candidatus Paceibacterota bacterium]|nr:plastocyanin/azurin family copper-binding protein [Candidatus Paceibacterota bacterium]